MHPTHDLLPRQDFRSFRELSFAQFEDLCDDPSRDRPGHAGVRALLAFTDAQGFQLWAMDGEALYRIRDHFGDPMRYRTIEVALGALMEVPGLSTDVSVVMPPAVDRRQAGGEAIGHG